LKAGTASYFRGVEKRKSSVKILYSEKKGSWSCRYLYELNHLKKKKRNLSPRNKGGSEGKKDHMTIWAREKGGPESVKRICVSLRGSGGQTRTPQRGLFSERGELACGRTRRVAGQGKLVGPAA